MNTKEESNERRNERTKERKNEKNGTQRKDWTLSLRPLRSYLTDNLT